MVFVVFKDKQKLTRPQKTALNKLAESFPRVATTDSDWIAEVRQYCAANGIDFTMAARYLGIPGYRK